MKTPLLYSFALMLMPAGGALAGAGADVGAAASAGGAAASAETGGRPAGWLLTSAGYTHQAEAELDSSETVFSADRWRLEAGTRLPLSDVLTLTIGAEVEWSRYDFGRFDSVAAGLESPGDDFLTAQLGFFGAYELDETWALALGGSVSWGGDLDAGFSDGVGGMGLLGVKYSFTPEFSLTPGVLVLSRLEDDAFFVPVLGVDWQMAEAWRLRSIGPGAELTWQAGDDWGVFLRGLYRPREFRLASDASVGSGVLRDRGFPISLGLEWKPNARVTGTIFGGAVVGGSLRLKDDGGDDVFEEDYEATPIFGGSLGILF